MANTRLTVLGAAAAAALAYTAYRSRHNARSLRRGAGTTSAAARELAIPESAVGTVLEKEQLDSDRIISAPGGAATFLVRYGSRNAQGSRSPRPGWSPSRAETRPRAGGRCSAGRTARRA